MIIKLEKKINSEADTSADVYFASSSTLVGDRVRGILIYQSRKEALFMIISSKILGQPLSQ